MSQDSCLREIADAVEEYRILLNADQPTNLEADDPRIKNYADAGEVLADRIERALRS